MKKSTLLWLAIFFAVLPKIAQSMNSQEQEALTLRMCNRVIAEYADALTFGIPYKDFQILEAEFHRCEELIDGYLLDTR